MIVKIEKMGVLSNAISREQLKPGDHIYSWRHAYIYAHHGIYIGNGMVIHFTSGGDLETSTGTSLNRFVVSSSPQFPDNPCLVCGDQSSSGGVICSCLDCFIAGGDLNIFEYGVKVAFFLAKVRGGTCTLASSDSTEVVLGRTSFLLQHGFGMYNTFKNNCEDFAIYCKTGLISLGTNGQAGSLLSAINSFLSSPLRYLFTSCCSPTLVIVGTHYCVGRYFSDIGVRSDVAKIPVEELVSRFCSVNALEEATETAKDK